MLVNSLLGWLKRHTCDECFHTAHLDHEGSGGALAFCVKLKMFCYTWEGAKQKFSKRAKNLPVFTKRQKSV